MNLPEWKGIMRVVRRFIEGNAPLRGIELKAREDYTRLPRVSMLNQVTNP